MRSGSGQPSEGSRGSARRALRDEGGGEKGIRTPGGVSPTHDFQSCRFSQALASLRYGHGAPRMGAPTRVPEALRLHDAGARGKPGARQSPRSGAPICRAPRRFRLRRVRARPSNDAHRQRLGPRGSFGRRSNASLSHASPASAGPRRSSAEGCPRSLLRYLSLALSHPVAGLAASVCAWFECGPVGRCASSPRGPARPGSFLTS
jgi:hypothetical protein